MLGDVMHRRKVVEAGSARAPMARLAPHGDLAVPQEALRADAISLCVPAVLDRAELWMYPKAMLTVVGLVYVQPAD